MPVWHVVAVLVAQGHRHLGGSERLPIIWEMDYTIPHCNI